MRCCGGVWVIMKTPKPFATAKLTRDDKRLVAGLRRHLAALRKAGEDGRHQRLVDALIVELGGLMGPNLSGHLRAVETAALQVEETVSDLRDAWEAR